MARIIRIFQPGNYTQNDTIELFASASQHVAVVLRRQPGDALCLFNGHNQECQAEITGIIKNRVTVQVHSCQTTSRESPTQIHLAQAISKGERMDFIVQKAVELGVTSITPLITEHCVVRLDRMRMEKKQKLWQSIAISACEQCGRNQIPVIEPLCAFEDYIEQCNASLKLILQPGSAASWRNIPTNTSPMSLLIGPEGGLSAREVELAKARQFSPLCLGPRVLRTETAAIAALSILQAACGDL